MKFLGYLCCCLTFFYSLALYAQDDNQLLATDSTEVITIQELPVIDTSLCRGNISNSLRQGKWKCFDPNDKLLAEGNYKNGKKDGIWVFYDQKGLAIEAIQFKEDQQNGVLRKYENRKTVYECYYKNGVKEGQEIFYYWDGSIQKLYNYRQGELWDNNLEYFGDNITALSLEFLADDKRGEGKLNYKDGKPEVSFHYIRNELEGEWIAYHPDEKPHIKGIFKDDSLYFEWAAFTPEGEKKWEIFIKRNLPHSRWDRYDILPNYKQIQQFDSGKLMKVSDFVGQRDKLAGGKLKAGTGERYWYDQNKCLKAKGLYQNGKLNGQYWLYANCTIKEIAIFNYQDNELAGQFQLFYNNGKPATIGYMTTGQIDSIYTEFYKNGSKAIEGKYKQGRKQGVWQTYYENGKLHTQESYDDDVLQGQATIFYEDGTTPKETFFYEAGIKNGKATAYHLNNKPAAEGNYTQDSKDGFWQYFHANGQVAEKGNYETGLRQGEWLSFHENGVLQSKGLFAEDVEDSLWTYFDDKNRLSETELWRKGKLMEATQRHYKRKKKKPQATLLVCKGGAGTYLQYYDKDRKNLKVRGLMKDGMPTGGWTFYDPTDGAAPEGTFYKGQIAAEGYFENGLRQGRWKFYKAGKIFTEGNYLNGQKTGNWYYYDTKKAKPRLVVY
jgi:uncharacterized protein